MRLNAYYFDVRGVKCVRSECTCQASKERSAETDQLARGSGVQQESYAADSAEGSSSTAGDVPVPAGVVPSGRADMEVGAESDA